VAGFHHGFFIFAILLTALSIIPLGGGIVTIPFGIGMIFYGNVFGGAFVVLWHLLVVTNIDVYLAVYKGIELEEHDEQPVRRNWLLRRKAEASATKSASE
jgi:hypothetical protein